MDVQITFSQQQLGVLNQALSELPYKIAAPLVWHINAQIQKQFDAKRDVEAPSGAPVEAA